MGFVALQLQFVPGGARTHFAVDLPSTSDLSSHPPTPSAPTTTAAASTIPTELPVFLRRMRLYEQRAAERRAAIEEALSSAGWARPVPRLSPAEMDQLTERLYAPRRRAADAATTTMTTSSPTSATVAPTPTGGGAIVAVDASGGASGGRSSAAATTTGGVVRARAPLTMRAVVIG